MNVDFLVLNANQYLDLMQIVYRSTLMNAPQDMIYLAFEQQ